MKSLIVFYSVSAQDKGIHVILGMFPRNSVARKMICEVRITDYKMDWYQFILKEYPDIFYCLSDHCNFRVMKLTCYEVTYSLDLPVQTWQSGSTIALNWLVCHHNPMVLKLSLIFTKQRFCDSSRLIERRCTVRITSGYSLTAKTGGGYPEQGKTTHALILKWNAKYKTTFLFFTATWSLPQDTLLATIIR